MENNKRRCVDGILGLYPKSVFGLWTKYNLKVVGVCEMHGTRDPVVMVLFAFRLISAICTICK